MELNSRNFKKHISFELLKLKEHMQNPQMGINPLAEYDYLAYHSCKSNIKKVMSSQHLHLISFFPYFFNINPSMNSFCHNVKKQAQNDVNKMTLSLEMSWVELGSKLSNKSMVSSVNYD